MEESENLRTEYFERIRLLNGLPFWINNPQLHEYLFERNIVGNPETSDWSFCCFNHAVGTPEKKGFHVPILPYQKEILDLLFDQGKKELYIKKARGIGATELFLRIMSWLATSSFDYFGNQMALVTGIRLDLAKDLMRRMKLIFYPRLEIRFPYNDTTLLLNGVTINSYPAHTIFVARGQDKMAFVLVDEGDFFPLSIIPEFRSVVEGYKGKSDPYIVLVSTPYEPGGLFETIENEPNEQCMYHKLFYDWTHVKDILLDSKIINRIAKSNPETFYREFMLKYGFMTGRIFEDSTIEMITRVGLENRPHNQIYHPPYISRNSIKVLFCDPGFGDVSAFATVIIEYIKEKQLLRVIHADKERHSNYDKMTNKIEALHNEFGLECIYVDAADAGLISNLRSRLGDETDERTIDHIEKTAQQRKERIENYFLVNGFPFSNRKREILSHARSIVDTENYVAVDPQQFHDLVVDLRTIRQKDGKLEKDPTNHYDLADAFLGCLCFYSFK
jgi:hypothetical protein